MTVPTKAEVNDLTRDSLFNLSAGDLDALQEGLQLREQWQERSGLDARLFL